MPRKSSALFFAFLLLFPTATIAQIIPDRTLGTENSRTVSDSINNLPSDRIEGGASRGSSLFHSFREFNVGEGRGAYFANPNGIANIFTRVTGSNSSNILGTLGVQGNANLFLLNPKGIIFGPNARLDLRGSFIGSTADSIVFNNGFEFSSANPSAVPLLAINIPVGLRFRDNPGTIVNTSQAMGPTPTLPPLPIEVPVSNKLGLAVDPGQTLALIGGDIQLNGGNLTAYTGQILLGSVKTPGLVQFEPTALGLNLNYSNIQNFGNIEMNGALINTSGLGGGKIDIRGSNVTVSSSGIYSLTLGNLDGRSIDINAQNLRVDKGSQILSATLGDGKGNNLNIHATDSVEMSGLGIEGYQRVYSQYLASGAFNPFDPQIMLSAGTAGSGAAGNINIDTPRLLLRDGALGGTSTFTAANAGNLNIRANTVELIGSVLNSGTTRGSTGQGGSITVDAQRLIMRDGASLIGISRSDGASGNIAIKTNESVELSGSLGGGTGQTTLATSSFDGKGKAGDITIDTKRLTVSNGAVITLSTGTIIGENVFSTGGGPGGTLTIRASDSIEVSGVSGVLTGGNAGFAPSVLGTQTTSSGRGGDIRLSTPRLTLRDGGIITAGSLSAADAGDITINADRTEVQGSGNNGRFSSRIEASAGRAFSFVNPNATGNAGSLNLNVNQLIIRDGATVNVASIGSGRAGNINVVADAIALDNKASIDGTTVSGTGANINLRSRSIQLRRNSRITTDAGISEGGNIRINSDILLALPRENSDITANARTARGGQVTVNVPNIFGFTSINREAARSTLGLTDAEFANLQVNPTSLIPTSDIAAISQQAGPALQGAVTFSTSGVNPAQGLVELPQNVISPEALIVANPCTQGAGSEFTITGKGGIPANPNDLLSSDSTLFSWVEPAVGSSQNLQGTKAEIEIQPQPVIPAQGWVINADGQVTLVAYNQMAQVPQRSKPALPVCRER
ncbi:MULTISPECIES: filamentous hemagglutinin N-terminal domain-containing protein [unclassified Microcoleus]|uniref:two-partner secretion domain-containing protein n=1 Tax=unclassified Microcoleus TaxID=2642155 RepID=UPI001DD05215|nr:MULTISPECIES: filamentous hemagglutinin N-terminal domain-containing protein [unclassified Microcoleus]MCC3434112.1 filamentous hemagglutinin N-terminal domain-containing protein [Microcoleus sp. PH2017_05_CCC_O_A]MCC3454961.1 filamentous hemagglutinin N-terminal domain-containing protein [Microcoleus sp. PH2017_08_TRC_O_A]